MQQNRHRNGTFARGGTGWLFALGAIGVGLFAAPTRAQDDADMPEAAPADVEELMRDRGIDANSGVAETLREQQARRNAAEKELRRVRLKNFGTMKKVEIRQEGIARLRSHTDPALFALMVDLFSREQNDVRDAMTMMFYESASREGDASLAWLAIYGRDDYLRNKGLTLLTQRFEDEKRLREKAAKQPETRAGKGPQTEAIQSDAPTGPQQLRHDPVDAARIVIYEGLRRGSNKVKGRAAELAADLKLVELIPWLAAAQVSGRPASGGSSGGTEDPNGSLAYIVVGTQQAFVADLEPVVSEGAVAFDPTLSTITEGTVLRVIDAVVYTYHVEVHRPLVRLASEAAGRDMADLGWDYRKWAQWYYKDYLPSRDAAQASIAVPPK
jgi:hypothetical protein